MYTSENSVYVKSDGQFAHFSNFTQMFLVKGYVATVTAIVATSCIKEQNLVAILQSDCVAYLV